MAAVGLTDVYKYGARFLAQLLVVVLVGVVLVLTGDLVGGFIVGSATDPALRTPPNQSGWAGVAIAGIGILATLSGTVGLLFKLVADGTAAGTRSVVDDGVRQAASAEESDEGEADETEADTGQSEETEQSSRPEPEQAPVAQASQETGDSGSEPLEQPRQSEMPPQADGPAQETPVDDQTGAAPAHSGNGTEEPRAESTASAAEAEPAAAEPTEMGEDGASVENDGDETTQTREEPPEWTPPDPSEFEQSRDESTVAGDPQSRSTAEQSEVTDEPFSEDTAGNYADETKIVDEPTFEEADASATSWEDLKSSSGSGEGIDDQSPSEWTDETEEITEGSDEESTEPESDTGANFESFETSDGDPLSDALDDE